MNPLTKRALLGMSAATALTALVGCGKKEEPPRPAAAPASASAAESLKSAAPETTTCTVSLQMNHYRKPFDNQSIAIFAVIDNKILSGKMLGRGQTDARGMATVDFTCSKLSSKYVIVWMPEGKCCAILRHEGEALSFDWDAAKQEIKKDLGTITFEVFEFNFRT